MQHQGIIFKDLKGNEVDILEFVRENKIKAVFFDLGDTLVEIRPETKTKIVQRINNECGLKIDSTAFDQATREEWKRRESQRERDRIKSVTEPLMEKGYWIEFYKRILERLGTRAGNPELVKWLAKTQSNYKSFALLPGITFFLSEFDELRKSGIRVGIISNAFPSAREIIANLLPIQFDDLILSYEYNSVKPEEDIYRRAARKAGVKAGEILFVDDRLSFVQGAVAYGMRAVLITKNPKRNSRDIGAGTDSARQPDQVNTPNGGISYPMDCLQQNTFSV